MTYVNYNIKNLTLEEKRIAIDTLEKVTNLKYSFLHSYGDIDEAGYLLIRNKDIITTRINTFDLPFKNFAINNVEIGFL